MTPHVHSPLLLVCLLAAHAVLAEDTADHASHTDHAQPSEAHATPSEDHDHVHRDHAPTDTPTISEREHVPPDPAQHPFEHVSEKEMFELMDMDDGAAFALIQLDELEWQRADSHDSAAWDARAWYGNDYDKVWIESEGARDRGTSEGRAELLWNRIVAPWWSVQSGIRQDFGPGPGRTWLSVGVAGLAPYFFEIDAALYVGEQSRTAARLAAEYELLLTQRWILQSGLELHLYGKDDPRNGIGSGLSELELGLRLRYEVRRELAPYVGVEWQRKFGDTASLARNEDEEVSVVALVAGMRLWF